MSAHKNLMAFAESARLRPLSVVAASMLLFGGVVVGSAVASLRTDVAWAQASASTRPVRESFQPMSSPEGGMGAPISRDGIEVPTEAITPFVQCLLDNGFYIAEVHQPPVPGATPFFVYGSSLAGDAARAAGTTCTDRYAPPHEPTEDEIREVYARWVGERECLIRLGYQPQEPPSVETFIQSYHTGPWMPIDGVPYSSWTDEEYRTAKVECGLEMYDR